MKLQSSKKQRSEIKIEENKHVLVDNLWKGILQTKFYGAFNKRDLNDERIQVYEINYKNMYINQRLIESR